MKTFDQLRSDWGFHEKFTLEDAMAKWEQLVKDVEAGYPLSIYDYEADLAFREDLDEVVANLAADLSRELTNRLRDLDERFFAATVATDLPLLAPLDDDPVHPVWFRSPAKLKCVDESVAETWRA